MPGLHGFAAGTDRLQAGRKAEWVTEECKQGGWLSSQALAVTLDAGWAYPTAITCARCMRVRPAVPAVPLLPCCARCALWVWPCPGRQSAPAVLTADLGPPAPTSYLQSSRAMGAPTGSMRWR